MSISNENVQKDKPCFGTLDQTKITQGISTIHCAPLHSELCKNAKDDKSYIGTKITVEDAKIGKTTRPIRIYADGVYDLFHHGHARQLQQVKKLFPLCETYLIVGVNSDQVVEAKKGKTLMSESERYESVRHCRYVDCVVEDAPWIINEEFIKQHAIDFVAHDDIPYCSGDEKDVYADLKNKNMFVATQRTEGISTSDIIARVVRDYEKYADRNIKRGYSREEINYSRTRQGFMKLANLIDALFNLIWKFNYFS